MKKVLSLILIILLLGMFSSCSSSLTAKGKSVKYATKSEAPSNCKEIGEVEIGFPKAISASDAKVKLRNETAEKGGNFLVIDTIEVNYNNSGKYYEGSGRAYICE
jgi:hypothetical protein